MRDVMAGYNKERQKSREWFTGNGIFKSDRCKNPVEGFWFLSFLEFWDELIIL
ncbi:hypothetical protein ACE1TI_17300 [Alteribacillus sp. JSM 102045]|uniref:hypothetical protein n=1 Tax=Alteribacillus sp. JSM 102045 TaxID=1562101 RepID=UPI0035C0D4D1